MNDARLSEEEKFAHKNYMLDRVINQLSDKYGKDSSELLELNSIVDRCRRQLSSMDDAIHIKTLHHMHFSMVLELGKKAADNIFHMPDASPDYVALACLYATYEREVNTSTLWRSIKRFFR